MEGAAGMSVTDEQLQVDPELEEQVRRAYAGASWFVLASATAKAHHDYDALRRQHDQAATDHARARLHVLELMLAAEGARLHREA